MSELREEKSETSHASRYLTKSIVEPTEVDFSKYIQVRARINNAKSETHDFYRSLERSLPIIKTADFEGISLTPLIELTMMKYELPLTYGVTVDYWSNKY